MATDTAPLTDIECAILELERGWFKYAGAKETTIRDRFGFSGIRYYQLLNALIDRPAALKHDAVLIRRLRRLRDEREAQRTTRRRA